MVSYSDTQQMDFITKSFSDIFHVTHLMIAWDKLGMKTSYFLSCLIIGFDKWNNKHQISH